MKLSELRQIIREEVKRALNEGVKWKPSNNPKAEGYVSKSFPHSKGDGDALLTREKFITKWGDRIKSWIGVKPKLNAVKEFFPNNTMNFTFVGDDGYSYKIFSLGEGPKSKQYQIQKLKK